MQNEQESQREMNEMKQTKTNWMRVVAAGVLAGFGCEAQAALVLPAGNSLVVNDTDLNVTWTQDANLFKTMYDANPNLVSQIIGPMPPIGDGSFFYTVTSGDFDTTTGQMSWWGAQAWVGYLNSISYGGVTGWRLPNADPLCGFSSNCTSSELGHLYYTELNKVAYPAANSGILGTGASSDTSGSVGPFDNAHTWGYWSGTEYASFAGIAWSFGTSTGGQGQLAKGDSIYGWAVRDGQVAAVPVPAAVWLMGSGVMGFLGWRRTTAGTLALG